MLVYKIEKESVNYIQVFFFFFFFFFSYYYFENYVSTFQKRSFAHSFMDHPFNMNEIGKKKIIKVYSSTINN